MQEPQARYFEALPGYVTVQDREFHIIDSNRRFRSHFGDWEGRRCYQVYKRRSEECESCPVARTFRDGECHRSEQQVTPLDGPETTVLVYTMPIRDASGEITAVVEMSTDITDIKRLERKLRESQERYRTMFEEVPCYISVLDRDLGIIEANRRFREDFGDAPGCKCYELYKHRKKPCEPCVVQETFKDGQVRECEEVVTARDGRQINVLVHTAPIHDSKGGIKYVMEMSTNITQIRDLQDQLASLGLLIGSISHGIKGLLTGMDGGIYLVNTAMERDDKTRLAKGWEMVRRNVSRVKNMVMDILYYAKGRDPQWEAISPQVLLDEACGLIERKAHDHEIEIQRPEIEADGTFDGDYKAMRSMLVDVIENAIDACRIDKKKEEHHITVGCRGDKDQVCFEIADNGIGMDREAREKAFTLFFSSKGLEGTGLGMFIANRVAQSHGGSIELESDLDVGTRFLVTIPRRHSQPPDGGVDSTETALMALDADRDGL